ncbi:S49 family peptidase [Candidatus Symbiobacter mobilis]|uniref:Protease IV n=1 Tax=Candidatus Symbiobacter mobilis CR TaxID=946483 RepID=U5NCE7_9BURK|nr:S49 family peptidase [Candidatus Symbiobacter mobilis]AGX87893.1 protease IV [Candidatus Symbiobacter mobilis CR]
MSEDTDPDASTAQPAPARATKALAEEVPPPGWERAILEKLVLATLQEQRSARRWRTFVRLAWLGFFVVVVWLGFQQSVDKPGESPAHTAVVHIKGEIAADTVASAELLVPSLRSAFEDAGARAVVLRVNSPGGSPVQAGIVHDEILRLKALHKKPVYAVVEESCASAAYYIAVAADHIYVDKASIVGSIGVLFDGFGFTGVMEKIGIERRLLTAGGNKGILDPFSPETPEHRAFAQSLLDQIHRQFIAVVKAGRGTRLKDQQDGSDVFTGLFWNGEQAIALGLADQLGSLDYVAREVVHAEDIVDYTRQENVAERLVKRFGLAVGQGIARSVAPHPALRGMAP